jgi:hypothetical protein
LIWRKGEFLISGAIGPPYIRKAKTGRKGLPEENPEMSEAELEKISSIL